MYHNWQTHTRDVEKRFLASFDHRIWLRASIQFSTESHPLNMRMVSKEADPKYTTSDDFVSEFESTRRIFMRQFRYHSSEMLLSLLLSARPNEPFVRFSTTVRNQELNALIERIAGGRAPQELKFEGSNHIANFDEWLAYKLYGTSEAQLCPSVLSFVVQEAKLLSDRSAFNALKHGRAAIDVVNGDFALSVKSENSKQYVSVVKPTKVISFANWDEKMTPNGLEFSYTHAVESVDSEYDRIAIFVASLLMKAIKLSRIARLNGEKLPDDFQLVTDAKLEEGFVRVKGLRVDSSLQAEC